MASYENHIFTHVYHLIKYLELTMLIYLIYYIIDYPFTVW